MPDLAVWPTDGADGSVSSEARWRKMARLWVPSGVDGSPLATGGAFGLAPTLAAGPAISVTAGACWLDGHYAELTAPASIPVTANGLLVVRFTPADNHAELLYRDAATAPTQTLPTWELPIARMTAGAMTDLRARAGELAQYPPLYAIGSATQTINLTTFTPLTGMRLTPPAPGYYLVGLQVDMNVQTVGTALLQLILGVAGAGATIQQVRAVTTLVTGAPRLTLPVQGIARFPDAGGGQVAAGSYVEGQSALNVANGAATITGAGSSIIATRIGNP